MCARRCRHATVPLSPARAAGFHSTVMQVHASMQHGAGGAALQRPWGRQTHPRMRTPPVLALVRAPLPAAPAGDGLHGALGPPGGGPCTCCTAASWGSLHYGLEPLQVHMRPSSCTAATHSAGLPPLLLPLPLQCAAAWAAGQTAWLPGPVCLSAGCSLAANPCRPVSTAADMASDAGRRTAGGGGGGLAGRLTHRGGMFGPTEAARRPQAAAGGPHPSPIAADVAFGPSRSALPPSALSLPHTRDRPQRCPSWRPLSDSGGHLPRQPRDGPLTRWRACLRPRRPA